MPKPNLHLERIRELIAIMRESGVSELAVELPDLKISLKREVDAQEAPAESIGGAEAKPAQPSPTATAAAASPALLPVLAPMVGIFRATGDHGRAVAPGDTVTAGQVIGAIEAMKVPNDIPAPVSGVVREVLVADGAPVEYGEPLMLVEPLAAAEGVEVETEAL